MKSLIFGLAVAAVAVGMSAFTAPQVQSKAILASQFSFIGGQNINDATDPSQYSSTPPVDCGVQGKLCAVTATDDGTGHPKQSELTSLTSDLNTAISGGSVTNPDVETKE
ncbi:hypothetical protein [Chitinophaga sp. MM2321]|uniref:hypothetical protein n=1 Tax=Chitinophaga sp. MM2321 TaxID=3137178 RepID=UPI0032D5708F